MGENRETLRFWLITASVLAILFGAVGFAATRWVVQSQFEHFAGRFMLLSTLRKQALEDYLDTARAEITFWSLNRDLITRQKELLKRWDIYRKKQGDPGAKLRQLYINDNPYPPGERHQLQDAGDGSIYSALHTEFHPLAKLFVTERGYYDFFLISPDGDIFYTVEKESDFGTNLRTGPWRESGLAGVFDRALASAEDGAVVFSDLELYGPSEAAPAMFMARAMSDSDGRLLGVLALQLPTDRIRSIMQFTAGMGDSGETYLVGEDLLMRSDSRFSRVSTILKVNVDTEPVKRALAGERGSALAADYRGVKVLSAYSTLQIDNFRWAVMAEIDRDEVLQTMANKQPMIAGLILVLYTLALWSLWYVRSGDWSGDNFAGLSNETDQPELSGPG